MRTDSVERKYLLPELERQYRDIRVALEDSKDYRSATGFYVGEMEARRRQMNILRRYSFSVEALYKLLSHYSSNPTRAIGVFLLFTSLHALITWRLLAQTNADRLDQLKQLCTGADCVRAYFTNSLNVLTVRRRDFIDLGGWHDTLDTIFSIIGPIQIALIALALRTMVKRH